MRSGCTVAETCFEVGFDSVTSFTGLFKKNEGVSPSVYQRQYKARQKRIQEIPFIYSKLFC
ncbi:MAG: AraC family transcriptional regulator [Saprospiraceae bacterium]|nr:AraC family transcriptional regulator [Saprospiraceae bacterium]